MRLITRHVHTQLSDCSVICIWTEEYPLIIKRLFEYLLGGPPPFNIKGIGLGVGVGVGVGVVE